MLLISLCFKRAVNASLFKERSSDSASPLTLMVLVGFPSCSVFLLDRLSHELVAKVFDGGVVSDEEVRERSLLRP